MDQSSQPGKSMQLFAEGKIDAFMGFAARTPGNAREEDRPRPDQHYGTDQPWSQYFCCMVAANREFARKNPVATKRALRAMLKAADVCAQASRSGPPT